MGMEERIEREEWKGYMERELRSTTLLSVPALPWLEHYFPHLTVLCEIQQRAERRIEDSLPEQQATSLCSLHSLHCQRDMAGLATLYKVLEQWPPHLQQPKF